MRREAPDAERLERMRRGFAGLAMLVVLAASIRLVSGQAPPAFSPLHVHVPAPPRVLPGGGAVHLVYELHLANLTPRAITLEALEVRDRGRPEAAALLRLDGVAL